MRMSGSTSVTVLNIDDRITQLQLAQGTLNIRVRRLDPNQVLKSTRRILRLRCASPATTGSMVDPDGDATTILVRNGEGEVFGEGAAYMLTRGNRIASRERGCAITSRSPAARR